MEEWSIRELQQKMTSGELSARQLCALYLERIQQIDRNGPALNAIIELNPEALAIADGLDQERKSGQVRGPLHGVPVVIKDNIDTADRMTTTAGSLALEGSIARRDAFLVERLRQAGAVILAKTNLSEWANFRSEHSVSGWSSRGGQTRNPYALDRNPCGSSSGSAVAVAANLCAAAVEGSRGSTPASAPKRTAASSTVRAIGPAVSWLWAMGTIPARLTSPTVGLIPTMPLVCAGQMIEPSVSVPTEAAHRSAATATAEPELDPHGLRSSA